MKFNRLWKLDLEEKLFHRLGRIKGDKFLFLDLDVIIHQDLKYFFDLPMDKPYIVRGWWNNPDICKKNFAKHENIQIIQADFTKFNFLQFKADCYFFANPLKDESIFIEIVKTYVEFGALIT